MVEKHEHSAKNHIKKSYPGLAYAAHAIERMAQSNLEPFEIDLVVRYGQMVHRTGVHFSFSGEEIYRDFCTRNRAG